MVISSRPAFRPSKCQRQTVVAIGLCAVLLAFSADACRDTLAAPMNAEYEAAKNATQQLRIKRLKPADPESTETMLADRGSAYPDQSKALG
jgi:hypothetical protein